VVPDWLNIERLQNLNTLLIVVLGVAALFAIRLIKKIGTLLIFLLIIGSVVGLLWGQRTELRECQLSCSCQLFGQSVEIPTNPLCGADRITTGSLLSRD
jgi:hypothetical protein